MIVEMPAGTELDTKVENWAKFYERNFGITFPFPDDSYPAQYNRWLICELSGLDMGRIVQAMERRGIVVVKTWNNLDKMDAVTPLPSWMALSREGMGVREVSREDEAQTQYCNWYEVPAAREAAASAEVDLAQKSASELSRLMIHCMNLRGYLLLWFFFWQMGIVLDSAGETLCVAPQDHFGNCAAVSWHHGSHGDFLRIRKVHKFYSNGQVRARRVYLH